MKFRFVLPALLLLGGMTNTVNASSGDMSHEAISERIAPVGQVYLAGEAPVAAEAETAAASGPRDGASIYQTFCVACHATGAAGAPKVGDVAAWSERQGKGLETLVSNAINGINAMPPRGTCMDCSDDEIKASVEHMLEQSL